MSVETTLKICVVGPSKTGKTLFCRAVAEQPILQGEYHPTAALRIQELSKMLGVDRVKLQFWDCSGSAQYQSYWPVLAKDLDGVVMVMDPEQPDHEKELEQFYLNFAQPNNLTVKQCLIVALQVVKEGSYGLAGWQGVQGKLSKLNQGYVTLNPASPAAGVSEALTFLNALLQGCLAVKKDSLERSVVDE